MVLIPAAVDPDDARRRAEEILSRREFRLEEPSLLDRAFDWVLDRVGGLLSALAPGEGVLVGYLILGVVVAALVYLIWRFAPRRRLRRDRVVSGLVTGLDRRRDRAAWLAEAERAEAAGDWAVAVHARYHALVSGLADRSELADDPAATSGERRREFAVSATPAGPPSRDRLDRFDDASTRFEDVRYGGRSPGRADSDALIDDDRRLLDGGGGGGA